MNSTAMKSINYHSAVLMIKDIFMKMEKQAMHMDIHQFFPNDFFHL